MSGGFIGSGVGGGVHWDKNADLEWQLKQMQADMNIMWNRLNDLEEARDEKVEPYDVKDYIRATKPDAGEPTHKYFEACLQENAKLIEENDVLRYQYEAMREQTIKNQDRIRELENENKDLGGSITTQANNYRSLFNQRDELVKENKRLEKIVADKEKVLEMTMDQRDEYGKTLIRLNNENKRLEEDVRGAHERVKELDKPYATQLLPTQLNDYIDVLGNLAKKNQKIDELTKKYEGEKAAAIGLEESSTYWQQKYNEQLQTTDILYKELDFFRKLTYDLEMEKKDAKWYKEQAIEKCIDIVEKIKNDPLTSGDGKRWMVAICEDIQKTIKNEFGVK